MTVHNATTTAGEVAIPIPMPELRHLVLAASVLIVLLQTMGGPVSEGAAFTGLLLAGLIGWKVDFRYLPALLLLSFAALGLARGGDGLEAPLIDAVAHVVLAGADFTAPLVAMLAATARTLYEATRSREVRLGWPSQWPVFLLLLALGVAVLCGLHGRALGLNRWSEGVRSVLAVGGFFWGFALTRTAYFDAEQLERLTIRVTLVGSLLVGMAVLRGHFIFLITALAATLMPLFIARRRLGAAALTAGVAAFALVGLTLTTAGIVLLAGTALVLGSMPLPALRRLLVYGAGLVVIVASIGAIWAVRTYGDALAFELTKQATESEGVLSYAMFKLMGDRGPLWLAAIQQIMSGPHVIPPTGRELLPGVGWVMGTEWEYGPHNSALQVLRSIGLVGGAVLLGLMLYFLFQSLRSLTRPGSRLARPLAAAFIGVVVAGGTTGDFPIQDVGFFVWVMGGIVAGVTDGR